MRLPAFVLLLSLPMAAWAQAPADPGDDLAAVLGAALFPVQFMAYCHAEIGPDPAYQNAGLAWTERNGELLETLETMAAAAGVPEEARRAADVQALGEIETMVASQGDQPAYCRFIAGVIDSGHYDLDQREDLASALKRIFGTE